MMISLFHVSHYQTPDNDSGCITTNLYLSHVNPALNVAAPPECAMWSIPRHTWHETTRHRVVARYMLIINKL